MENPTGLAKAFRAVQSSTDRKAVLDALVDELDPYEWRHVKSRLIERTFDFDIVGTSD